MQSGVEGIRAFGEKIRGNILIGVSGTRGDDVTQRPPKTALPSVWAVDLFIVLAEILLYVFLSFFFLVEEIFCYLC